MSLREEMARKLANIKWPGMGDDGRLVAEECLRHCLHQMTGRY